MAIRIKPLISIARRFALLGIFLILLGQQFILAAQAQAAGTARDLAATFDLHAAVALGDDGPAGREAAYSALTVIDRILAEYPKSLEARLLVAKRRLPNRDVDLADLALLAEEWIAANPDLADTIRTETYAALGANIPTAERVNAPKPIRPLLVAPPPPPVDLSRLAPRAGAPIPSVLPPAVVSSRKPQTGDFREKLRRTSVLVYYVGQTKGGQLKAQHIGSGSFIGPDLVLTNAHVVDYDQGFVGSWLVINEHIGARPAKLISHASNDTPIKIDAAVLQVDGFRSAEWLSFNTDPRLDEQITIGGYPGDATIFDRRYPILNAALESGRAPDLSQLPTALLNEGRINNFIDNSVSKARDLQYTMVTAGGNSGSPVVNNCGEIVGLHYSGGAQGAKVKYNGAVHARDVALFLSYAGINVEISRDTCAASR